MTLFWPKRKNHYTAFHPATSPALLVSIICPATLLASHTPPPPPPPSAPTHPTPSHPIEFPVGNSLPFWSHRTVIDVRVVHQFDGKSDQMAWQSSVKERILSNRYPGNPCLKSYGYGMVTTRDVCFWLHWAWAWSPCHWCTR